jgi:glycosyltransferase involved in cell wall biosynthesis
VDVLCFGGEDWWYHNRGHIDMQLMRRFAKKGVVLYVNSIVMQRLNLTQTRKFAQRLARKARSIFTGLKRTEEGFWVYSPISFPVQHIAWARWLNERLVRLQIRLAMKRIRMATPVVWVACPAACDIAMGLKRAKLVHQRTDRFEDFPSVHVELVKDYDRRLKAAADLTIYVNSSMYGSEAGQCKNAVYLDHGVDFDAFASAQANPVVPQDIASIPKPIAGFIGSIDDCNPDIDLIAQVADLLPRMSFVLLGREQTDCSNLRSRKNVYMLGQKPYELVPQYGKSFDVAMLPVRQTSWTQAMNPLKLKEYLAMGKPVVSTPFAELTKYSNVVYEAKTPAEFALTIERAIAENTPELTTKRQQMVRNASWDSKAELILQKLFEEAP